MPVEMQTEVLTVEMFIWNLLRDIPKYHTIV